MTPQLKQSSRKGFTLAELLISLAILGVIATFTIPKILSAQQNAADSAKAKEAMATISAAYQAYQQNNVVTASTTSEILIPYMNYVARDTTSPIDNVPTNAPDSCTSKVCLKLHNGAMLARQPSESFNGTGATNGWWFLLDPDGIQNSSKPSVGFYLYYNGRITTHGKCSGNVDSSVFSYPCNPVYEPSWFSF